MADDVVGQFHRSRYLPIAIRSPATHLSKTSRHPVGWIACLGLALTMTSSVTAQQFQTPTLPGERAPIAVSPELQARIDYAEALKAQMLRAQAEQGARDEFARKAYEAQQAYQAQRAFDEYTAFMKTSQQQQQLAADLEAIMPTAAQPHPVSYQQTIQRIPKPAPAYRAEYRQSTPAPAFETAQPAQHTFAPPVHVTPRSEPAFASFGDQPKSRPGQPSQASQPQQTNPQPRVQQQAGYQTRQAPAGIPSNSTGFSAPQRVASHHSSQPHSVQPPSAPATSAGQNLPGSNRSQPEQANRAAAESQLSYAQRGYIIQENQPYEGLQDRFTQLISRRDRERSNGQPRLAQNKNSSTSKPADAKRRPTRSTAASAKSAHRPVRQLSASQSTTIRSGVGRRIAAKYPFKTSAAQTPQPSQTRPNRSASRTPTAAKHRPQVQRAIEFQPRQQQATHSPLPIQQVALVEPAQDPFNDQSVTVPPTLNSPRLQAPQVFQQPAPHAQSEPAIRLAPPEGDASTQQISVLSNGPQEPGGAQDNQFNQPANSATTPLNQGFQPPVQDNSTIEELPIGNQPAEDAQQADDELNRRMQELELGNSDERARVDEMVKEFDGNLNSDQMPQEGSIVDPSANLSQDEFGMDDRRGFIANQKSCDEFRQGLLDNSIRDISMDMSPLAGRNRNLQASLSRSWTDRRGNVVANGKMVDLRRGYVIIDGENGQQRIAYARLSDGDWAAIAHFWQIPDLCSVGNDGDASRNWAAQTYTWKASALCHKPLFFENRQLERYGHTHGPISQPIRSVAHFFVSFITVPYQSGIHPATECQYALGFYRPGDCAPWLKDPVPFSLNGTVRQAAVMTALGVIP